MQEMLLFRIKNLQIHRIKNPTNVTGKMLGADISFLPELEAKGMKFSDKGIQKDA